MRPDLGHYARALRGVRARQAAESGVTGPEAAQPGRRRRPLATGSPAAPSSVYDVALLDLDGVVYVGPDAVPGVPAGAGRRPRRRDAAGLRHQQRRPHAGGGRRPT